MPEPILVVGAGGHARAVLDAIRAAGRYTPVGLVESFQSPGTVCHGLRILGTEHALAEVCRQVGTRRGVIAIGDNWQRQQMANRMRAVCPEFEFVTVVHAAATVAHDVTLGSGTVVLPGAVVVSGCRIGEGCVVNTQASLDHDSVMEDYAQLAPGAVTGGWVRIGADTFVGLGARIKSRVQVGPHTVIGAGALVLKDCPSNVVAYGAPARVVRPRRADEPYL
jgi:sugar O-acyltransferase (sialic acid O-acetyltransferase NeuD family)